MTLFLILTVPIIIYFAVRRLRRNSASGLTNTSNYNKENITHDEIPLKLTPTQFSQKYKNGLGQIKGGTLCFWGHWFGRPYDNFHQITNSDFDTEHNILTIQFSDQGILTISNPHDIEEFKNRIHINNADKVIWQWYYYGKTQESENLYFYNIINSAGNLIGETNASWYKADWSDLTLSKPAVLFT